MPGARRGPVWPYPDVTTEYHQMLPLKAPCFSLVLRVYKFLMGLVRLPIPAVRSTRRDRLNRQDSRRVAGYQVSLGPARKGRSPASCRAAGSGPVTTFQRQEEERRLARTCTVVPNS